MEDDIFKELEAYKLESAGIGQNKAGCVTLFLFFFPPVSITFSDA